MKYFTAVLVLLVLAMAHTSNALSMSQVAGYWKRGGGSSSSCPTAVAVAWAESHGNPRARGNNPGSYDRGLWQINSKWHPDVSDSCAYNAACNAKNAVRISSGGSRWSPWATYNHGKHRQYLSQARSACSNSRDEDDYTGGVTIPDSGSKTWGKPEGRFGQGHVNWSGLSNLFKDDEEDALGGCCRAMMPQCWSCQATRNRMHMRQLRDSRMKDDDDDALGNWRGNQGGHRCMALSCEGIFFDEDDDQLGFDDFGRPSHTRPHMPDNKSVGDWLNFRL